MIFFEIPIHPVTKKNNQRIIPIKTKTGKIRNIPIPSKAYEDFERDCMPYLYQVKSKTGYFDKPINIKAVFYVGKRLRYDLTNLLEALDDTLVKSGLIVDDNRDIVAAHDGSRVFYDKYKPRIEVEISYITDYPQWRQNVEQQKIF